MNKAGLLDLLTGSGKPRTSRSCVVEPGWWYSWPMASILASLCLSQRWTFWTYVMTVNLFPRYLMNFMFHTLLDAADIILMSKKFLPLYNSAKIIKIDRDFPKLWSQMYCHLFYGSQCTLKAALHCVTLFTIIYSQANSVWCLVKEIIVGLLYLFSPKLVYSV